MPAWLRFFPRRRAAARVVLVCFPPAGGAASAFARWPAALPPWLDLCAFGAPGHEGRFDEPPAASIAELADGAATAIAALDQPVAVLGHSLGSWIGFEAVRRLRAGHVPVVQFFPAGSRPPHLGARAGVGLDAASLIAYLRELGGTPEAVLAEPELLALVLPVLRADLVLSASHAADAEPLDVATTILSGAADRACPTELVERWQELIVPRAECLRFPGGHFFVQTARDAVIAAIVARLPATA